MKRPEIEGLDEEIVKYIEYLEGRGVSRLKLSLANLCSILADDIDIITSGGDVSMCRILDGDKDDKSFERMFIVVKNRTDLLSLDSYAIEEETTTKTVKKKTNIQDFIEKPIR